MNRVHAVRIHQHGGPEVLTYEEIDLGEPGPGEALVRQTVIGLNFADVHFRTGRYPVRELPHVMGMEAAGVIEAVGDGVTTLKAGDRVAYASDKPRAYAEASVMPITRLVKVPDNVDDETAAAVILKGLTAEYLIRAAYEIKAGQTILIQAAAGGVGQIMCQWAKHLGVTVIGTVSSDEKAELVRENGCEHPIVSTREDVVERVLELTDGKKLPVVYDGVGGATFESSLKCVQRRGMLVSYGTAGGKIPEFDLFRLNLMGSLYVTSAGLADYIHDRDELETRATDVFDKVGRGIVSVHVNQRYKLSDVATAHRDLEGRRTSGSSVILP